LIDLILNGQLGSPRERDDVLRLIYRHLKSGLGQDLWFWDKWGKIVGGSDEGLAEVSRSVHEEMTRRGLDLKVVLKDTESWAMY
jgi:hypothetical protein